MNFALNELYAGQPVICSGKPTQVLMASRGLVWLVGFLAPVRVSQVECV